MSYHWIITIQWPIGNGYATGTSTGVLPEIPEGVTRLDVYERILQLVSEEAGKARDDRPNVMFFSLEPNEL